jgi:short-subunit dehydrogenase
MNTTKDIFITGASGFIGNALVEALLKEGAYRIHCLVRDPDAARILEAQGAHICHGSLDDLEQHRDTICKASIVIHAAANASFRERGEYTATNITATETLTKILGDSTVLKRFIFLSTIGAVDRSPSDPCTTPLTTASETVPTSTYGKSKLAAEKIIQASSLPYTILRLTWIYGPGMRADSHVATFLAMGRRGHPLAYLGFTGNVSALYIDDLVRLCHILIEGQAWLRQTHFVGSRELLSIASIFRAGRALNQRSTTTLPLPCTPILGRLPLPFGAKVLLQDALVAESQADVLLQGHTTPHEEGLKKTYAYFFQRQGIYIITGAASGLGRAYAETLSAQKKQLLLIDKDELELKALAEKLSQKHQVIDLADATARLEFYESISSHQSLISGLITSAGFGLRGSFESHTLQAQKSLIDVNILSLTELTAVVLRKMKAQGFGSIILVASSVSEIPVPGMALYGASKAFVLSLGRSLWGEAQGSNIQIQTVCPSGMKTNFQRSAQVKVMKEGAGLLDPADVVARSLAALSKNQPTVFVGWKSRITSSIIQLLPEKLRITVWAFLFQKLR